MKNRKRFTSQESSRIFTHLKLTLGETNASQIMNATSRMLQDNNDKPEWTVNRLKSLKTWFIQHLSGNKEYSEPWFATRKFHGAVIPKGPFGALFKDALYNNSKTYTKRDYKKIIRVLSALMSYTGFRLKQPSKQQKLKSLGSIMGPKLDKTRVKQLNSMGKTLKSNLTPKELNIVKGFKRNQEKGFKFSPVSLNTGKPFAPAGMKYIDSFMHGLKHPTLVNYFKKYFVDFPDIETPQPRPEDFYEGASFNETAAAGKIIILQEAGAKGRVIANPSSAAQVAMSHLHKMLDSILKEMDTDVTHNQEDGALWAQNQLMHGNTVHSVDLSGATDNFPISLQLSLLRELGLKDEAKLLEDMASGIWILNDNLITSLLNGGRQTAVTYTRGQPMGLYSSFPLFGLTHNLLVKAMCKKIGIVPVNSFRILGDDIVLIDDRLHKMYREFMANSGVPISENKSISSDKLAEFAGFIITPKGSYKPAKVPDYSKRNAMDNSFINYLQVVGEEGIRLLPSKLRGIATRVANLPSEFGGLGLNSQGLSYDKRIENFYEIKHDEIPKYHSMESLFSVYRKDVTDDQDKVLVWLHDQWSLFENHAKELLVEYLPIDKVDIIRSSEIHSLAYQLSSLRDVQPDGKLMSGNTHPESSDPDSYNHSSVFTTWKNKFLDLDESDSIIVGGLPVSIPKHSSKPFKSGFMK